MRYYTHLAFGFLIALLLYPFLNISNLPIFFLIVLLGSILPDIDNKNSKISNHIPIIPYLLPTKHRGIFHSLLFTVLISGIVFYFTEIYGIALFIGYLSHIFIDSFTKAGINYLHPFATLRVSGFIETGTLSELLIFIILITLITIRLI